MSYIVVDIIIATEISRAKIAFGTPLSDNSIIGSLRGQIANNFELEGRGVWQTEPLTTDKSPVTNDQ
jgi:hypothetical protein